MFSKSCILSHFVKISSTVPFGPLWVAPKIEKLTMRVNWKPLLSLGLAFWGLLCCTDLLGESTWKRCSYSFGDILQGQYNEFRRMRQETKSAEPLETPTHKMNWSILLWNVCAFLCSLVFCSVLRSMSWVVWKLIKFYNVFRNRKILTNKVIAKAKAVEVETKSEAQGKEPENCQLIFRNHQILPNKPDNIKILEHVNLSKELEEMKKEKDELSQQLVLAQKENLTARQQIEEYKLETFMMKEKLARTTNSLKENLKYKDFANANQEMIARKAHTLEMHLKDVSRDRDILRSKLSSLEKSYSKIEERIKMYEKAESETNMEQFPEKDTPKQTITTNEESEVSKPENEITTFQQKIMDLQKSIGTFEAKQNFEANSKISVDLDESSFDTSKDDSDTRNANINLVKQNILNYNAYKTQMLKPKLKLSNYKQLYSPTDTTGSSSDENSGPHRIISSTVEFQNFLKTLTSSSRSSVNFNKKSVF